MHGKERIASHISKSAEIGKNVFIGENVLLDGDDIIIGDNVNIADGCAIRFESARIGSDVSIGKNTCISSDELRIGNDISIGIKNKILAPEKCIIGSHTNWGNKCNVTARSFEAGNYLQFYDEILVGKGGKYEPDSRLKIGSGCFIGARTMLNVSDHIDIGDNVGIGDECCLWTHGAYLDVMKGFPAKFAPIEIGNNVWMPARTVVLPGVRIGSSVVIGINSVVNKDVKDGSFAAGIPIKILYHNRYPVKLNESEKKKILEDIIDDYRKIIAYKELPVSVEYSGGTISLKGNDSDEATQYDIKTMQIKGSIDEFGEDLRDYLRRRGIKFFTSKRFRSIIPPIFKKYLER